MLIAVHSLVATLLGRSARGDTNELKTLLVALCVFGGVNKLSEWIDDDDDEEEEEEEEEEDASDDEAGSE